MKIYSNDIHILQHALLYHILAKISGITRHYIFEISSEKKPVVLVSLSQIKIVLLDD
jgi:hypothetical protein